jgi:membrane protein DedA with SNARE-associated domain
MEQNLIDFTKDIAMQYPYLAYIFFFISASLQILFPPYPGDTVLVLEGYLSSTGYFSPYLIALNAMAATFLSCILLYHLAYRLGDRIFEVSIIKKFFSRDKQQKLMDWFKKYGSAAILISKFVPGIGSLTMLVAGTFKVPRIKAYIAMGAATIIHNSFLVIIGRLAGSNMEHIKTIISKYNVVVIIVVFVCAGAYIYARVSRKTRQVRKDI